MAGFQSWPEVITVALGVLGVLIAFLAWWVPGLPAWSTNLILVAVASIGGAALSWAGARQRIARKRQDIKSIINGYGVTIETPQAGAVVTSKKVSVQGFFRQRPPGEWILVTQNGELYWIHGTVRFNDADSTWRGDAYVNMRMTAAQVIQLIELTDELRGAVEFYRRVGDRAGWEGIRLYAPAVRVAARVAVQARLP